ncbi:MAG: hypothetical protein GEU98_25260 [Pseudonocardiaceae bacterium]|nr:hypothetical protein [Pseudonocardiaceae bacterium]
MPLGAPRGRSVALASKRAPARVIGLVIALLVLWFVVVILLAISGVDDSLGVVRYGLSGAMGAGVVLLYRYNCYAVGEDWFRRGDSWVDTTALREVVVSGDALRLYGMERKRKASVPLHVLRENPALAAPLARAVGRAQARGTVTDEHVRELFALPGH